MYQSSVAFGNLIQQDSRTFRAQITLGDNSIAEGIRSIKINGGSNSEDDFSLGSAVSQYAEIDIAAPDIQFEGHEFLLELGIVVNDSVEEYVPMGYFTAEKPEGDEEQASIVAYDRMMKTERPCFLSLPDQTNTVDVLKAIGAITGVPVVTEGLASISMQKPVGYTCREVLSYVAQLYGGFAVCNRQGQIEIKTYEDHGYTVGTGRYWDTFTHNDLAYSLEKITYYTGKDESGENISITVGEGMRGISISNPFMTQVALNNIWASLNNYTYMPGSFRFLGDPRIDPWDILTVEDRNGKSYKVPAMKLTQDYDGGLSTEVEAVGKSEAEQESGFQGPMTQQMERYYAQLVLIDRAMINKLDAETARITYATIENLEAVNAAIENLDVTKLTARVATIEEAYIGKAEVNSLLAGYASITDLNATNANITSLTSRFSTFEQTTTQELVAAKGWMLEGSIGDAQISHVNANKIDTGILDTALVTVAGSDGRLQIIDNTIQISDANRVRVQIGKDDSGDYTLAVWDSSGNLIWDALGATESTIQRKIIRDKMVADDAAIQALKLDLQSFNTALTNQGVSISGTVVQVGNKTLNVALTEQTQLITDHGETLTDHATRITANENAIKLKVSTQEYESYKSTVNNEIASAKSRLSTAESSISALEDEISFKVTQTEIDTAINGIQIGGRNLILNSDFHNQFSKWINGGNAVLSYGTDGTYGTYLAFSCSGAGDMGGNRIYQGTFDVDGGGGHVAGKTYTLSFYAKTSAATGIHAGWVNGLKTFSVTTGWKRYTATYTPTGTGSLTFYIDTANVTLYLTKVMLEEATKASNWVLAQGDVDASITAVDNKFASYSTTVQMNAAITAAKDSITNTVSETYATKSQVNTVSGNVTTLTSRVSAAESKLTKDSLVTTIGSYYATQTYVDGIEIGGRNIWLNSTFDHDLDGYSTSLNGGTAAVANGYSGHKGVRLSRSGYAGEIRCWVVGNASLLSSREYSAGDTFTLSAWIYIEEELVCASGQRESAIMIRGTDGDAPQITIPEATPVGEWVHLKVSKTFTKAGRFSSPYVLLGANGSLIVSCIKLEKGTKATDWTPAPEDVDSSIASVQTIATQTSEKFNWLVKSGTSSTDFTLTDRTATLIANAINLKGLVTFSGLDSAAQSKITTAQNTADTALSYIEIDDTRNDNQTPQWYMTNHAGRIVRELKDCSKIGLSVSSTHCTLETKVPWRDSSGGYPAQVATVGNDNKVYKRIGTSNTTWSAWVSVDQVIADWCYDNNLTYINGGKIYTKSIKAAQIDVDDLFAQSITATGTITGATIKTSSTANGDFELSYGGLWQSKTVGYDSSNHYEAKVSVAQGAINLAETATGTPTNGYASSYYTWVKSGRIVVAEESVTNEVFSVKATPTDRGVRSYIPSYFYNTVNVLTNSTAEAQVNLSNSLTSGRVAASSSGRFGLYSAKYSKWIIMCDSDGTTIVDNTTSDIRLKENIQDTSIRALDVISRIQMRQFDWKRDGKHQDIGFVADELELVDPRLALGGGYEADGSMVPKAVNDFYLLGYTVKGIQELSDIAVKTESRLSTIEARMESKTLSMESQISSLQYQLQQAFTHIAELTKQIEQLQAVG